MEYAVCGSLALEKSMLISRRSSLIFVRKILNVFNIEILQQLQEQNGVHASIVCDPSEV